MKETYTCKVHGLAKRVPLETVAQALKNEPFEDYARAVCASKRICKEGGEAKDRFNKSYAQAVEGFLRQTYNSLTYIPGISFDIGKVSEQNERKALDAAQARYRALKMEGQVGSLEEVYGGLCALRTVFGNVIQQNCFNLETVVSSRYLPELLMAVPVWFVEPKVMPDKGSVGSQNSIVRYFCDLGVTDQFAHLFQIYNHSPRYFNEFEGRDVMPLPIIELVGKVRNSFDYLIIATPYHDLAAKQWRDSRWMRNIDPYLLGFLRQVPELMFFLGRWSGTGLFPLAADMIADTIEHIRKNKHLLGNFVYDIPWYRGGGNTPRLEGIESILYRRFCPHPLIEFADELFKHFEQGSLFSWLRGESQ